MALWKCAKSRTALSNESPRPPRPPCPSYLELVVDRRCKILPAARWLNLEMHSSRRIHSSERVLGCQFEIRLV
eukprot:5862941-Pyramimonas_sp.AAC.1